MNINQLEYFIAVADNLNFTKAANQCFISQTAMTQQIRNLEKTIGVNLFLRDKHHVELTTAGQIYLKEARAIVERSDKAMHMARVAASGIEGKLNIGFLSGFGQSDCAPLLRGFHSAYPDIELSFYRNTMSGLINAMHDRECDIAFALASKNSPQDLNYQYLRSYPLMAVVDEGHPLAYRRDVTYEDLHDENFILMQPSARGRDEMEELILMYEKGGYVPNVVGFEEEPETLLLMIEMGLGISIMPEYITRLHNRNSLLKVIPVLKSDGSAETLDFGMIWFNSNQNPAIDKLISWIDREE